MRILDLKRLALLPLAVVIASGCGTKQHADTKAKTATQLAAKVNSAEITLHQINFVQARSPNIRPEAALKARREILNRLIDQQLAKQEAMANKLDRSPNVVQAIEAARSEVLARAYLENMAASQSKPTEDEVRKYYSEHPELFVRRRIFDIEEIQVAPQNGLAPLLREQREIDNP